MKIPSSSIDDESVTKQIPNVESFGSTTDPNMGLKQLLPADLIIKGGIEKLREALPPPVNPNKPSKASCEARFHIQCSNRTLSIFNMSIILIKLVE